MQAEAVAQARAVAQLNVKMGYPPPAVGGVNPNLQWETSIPGYRPDLFIYDRNNATGQVGLVEMKLGESGGGTGAAGAQADMNRYLAALAETSTGRRVLPYAFPGGFSDQFFITLVLQRHFVIKGSAARVV